MHRAVPRCRVPRSPSASPPNRNTAPQSSGRTFHKLRPRRPSGKVVGHSAAPLSPTPYALMRFVNAPYVLEEQTTRQQWPAATMTWGERRLFSEGYSLHRDAATWGSPRVEISAGSTLYPSFDRSRQDAPAGSGHLLLHSPVALERSRRGLSTPDTTGLRTPATDAPLPQRWEPMRSRSAADASAHTQAWQIAIRTSFPHCTGHHVRVDKAALARVRAAERWAERLATRDGPFGKRA